MTFVHTSEPRASPVCGIECRSSKERQREPGRSLHRHEMVDRCFEPRLCFPHPVSAGKSLGRKRREKQEGSNKIVEKRTQTEPWYFRKPTVAGRAMYAFQENKTDKSQDIPPSREPKPNKTPLFRTLEGSGTSHRKNIFESLET